MPLLYYLLRNFAFLFDSECSNCRPAWTTHLTASSQPKRFVPSGSIRSNWALSKFNNTWINWRYRRRLSELVIHDTTFWFEPYLYPPLFSILYGSPLPNRLRVSICIRNWAIKLLQFNWRLRKSTTRRPVWPIRASHYRTPTFPDWTISILGKFHNGIALRRKERKKQNKLNCF